MRRDFTWTFTVANVKIPILSADFLAHYALAVHMNPRPLSDTTTNLRVLATDEFVHPQHLRDCEFVFVRNDAVRRPLTPAYQGPFQVLRRTDKHLTTKRANSTDTEERTPLDTVSLNRIPLLYNCIRHCSNNCVPKKRYFGYPSTVYTDPLSSKTPTPFFTKGEHPGIDWTSNTAVPSACLRAAALNPDNDPSTGTP
ncbi:unnamed protein product [Acanthosepion pharaonis]|uniref:Uncharacterized protein n=1 Tax=Acanthosepion pharaonis TaxID=158019 RepID=A0A812D993_ACAPH|nr:unnamed protein product [Sepia pharaonis]